MSTTPVPIPTLQGLAGGRVGWPSCSTPQTSQRIRSYRSAEGRSIRSSRSPLRSGAESSSRDRIEVTAAHGGQVVEWLVEDGDLVSPGQPLLRLHPEGSH